MWSPHESWRALSNDSPDSAPSNHTTLHQRKTLGREDSRAPCTHHTDKRVHFDLDLLSYHKRVHSTQKSSFFSLVRRYKQFQRWFPPRREEARIQLAAGSVWLIVIETTRLVHPLTRRSQRVRIIQQEDAKTKQTCMKRPAMRSLSLAKTLNKAS
jgi:hypothetical protein